MSPPPPPSNSIQDPTSIASSEQAVRGIQDYLNSMNQLNTLPTKNQKPSKKSSNLRWLEKAIKRNEAQDVDPELINQAYEDQYAMIQQKRKEWRLSFKHSSSIDEVIEKMSDEIDAWHEWRGLEWMYPTHRIPAPLQKKFDQLQEKFLGDLWQEWPRYTPLEQERLLTILVSFCVLEYGVVQEEQVESQENGSGKGEIKDKNNVESVEAIRAVRCFEVGRESAVFGFPFSAAQQDEAHALVLRNTVLISGDALRNQDCIQNIQENTHPQFLVCLQEWLSNKPESDRFSSLLRLMRPWLLMTLGTQTEMPWRAVLMSMASPQEQWSEDLMVRYYSTGEIVKGSWVHQVFEKTLTHRLLEAMPSMGLVRALELSHPRWSYLCKREEEPEKVYGLSVDSWSYCLTNETFKVHLQASLATPGSFFSLVAKVHERVVPEAGFLDWLKDSAEFESMVNQFAEKIRELMDPRRSPHRHLDWPIHMLEEWCQWPQSLQRQWVSTFRSLDPEAFAHWCKDIQQLGVISYKTGVGHRAIAVILECLCPEQADALAPSQPEMGVDPAKISHADTLTVCKSLISQLPEQEASVWRARLLELTLSPSTQNKPKMRL